MNETRQGKTGLWRFVMETPRHTIIATSEWGTNYEFALKEWQALPVVELTEPKE